MKTPTERSRSAGVVRTVRPVSEQRLGGLQRARRSLAKIAVEPAFAGERARRRFGLPAAERGQRRGAVAAEAAALVALGLPVTQEQDFGGRHRRVIYARLEEHACPITPVCTSSSPTASPSNTTPARKIVGYIAACKPATGPVQVVVMSRVDILDDKGRVLEHHDEFSFVPNVLSGFPAHRRPVVERSLVGASAARVAERGRAGEHRHHLRRRRLGRRHLAPDPPSA